MILHAMTVDDRVPWGVQETECNACGARWAAAYAFGTDTSKLECPMCHAHDSGEIDSEALNYELPSLH